MAEGSSVDEIFQHPPLNDAAPGAIRLLKLYHDPDIHATTKCSLVEANLDENLRYIALSYVWGPPEPTATILVDGKPFAVRRNLFVCLRSLVLDPDLCTENLFWIDQICIDQANISEKNQQVGQMARVYTEARSVIAWLGRGDDDTDAFIDVLASIENDEQAQECREDGWFREMFEVMKNLEYWSRLWIMQELLLNQHVTIVWGGRFLPFHNFFDRITEIEPDFGTHISNLNTARERIATDGVRKLDWYTACLTSRGTKCENPRDRFYGLLGLIDPRYAIQPDYEKDVISIYREVCDIEFRSPRYNPHRWNLGREMWCRELQIPFETSMEE